MAARLGDGLWTLADPEQAPEIIDAYREACDEPAGPGEIILQAGTWADDDDAALEGARVWKATQTTEYFTDGWHGPRRCTSGRSRGLRRRVPRSYIVGSDPEHTSSASARSRLGPTVICVQNASGADPHGALRIYGDEVLPALRAAPDKGRLKSGVAKRARAW